MERFMTMMHIQKNVAREIHDGTWHPELQRTKDIQSRSD